MKSLSQPTGPNRNQKRLARKLERRVRVSYRRREFENRSLRSVAYVNARSRIEAYFVELNNQRAQELKDALD